MKEKNVNYESPFVEIMDVEVEKGFAASAGASIDGMGQGNTSDWEVGF